MTRYCFLILSLLSGLLSVTAADQDKLKGSVIDADTDEPIPGVIVRSKGVFTSTDTFGRFTILPESGADSISF